MFKSSRLTRQLTMSLRRSARISTSNTLATPESNGTTNGDAKYVSKASTATKKRKSKAPAAPINNDEFVVPELPSTPLPKRPRKAASESPLKPPPFTPTPSGVGLLASTSQYGHPLETLPDLKPRPTEPHATNAPLSTPGGSRVVAYTSSPVKASSDAEESPAKKRKASAIVPPDVGTLRPPTSTVDTLLKDAEQHLISVSNGKLKGLIEKHRCKMFSPEGLSEVVDPFTALSSGIIGQQVR